MPFCYSQYMILTVKKERKFNEVRSKQKTVFFVLTLAIIACISAFLAFYNIGDIYFARWDEARHGINAYEMLKNNDFIVNTYNYNVDYWNLKPPLSYWCIMIFYKIFGYNVVGFKMYSAVSFILMLIVIGLFLYRSYGRKASVVGLLFIISSGIITGTHFARFADADCLYTLLYICAFIALMKVNESSWYMSGISGLCVSLAFLTKSYHAVTIFLSSVMYVILTKTYRKMNRKHYIAYFACLIIPTLAWAIARMSVDGITFLKEMLFHDFISRSYTVIENHNGPIYYYLSVIISCLKYPFISCIVALIIKVIFGRCKFNHISNTVSGLLIFIALPICMYSVSATKLSWYIFPQIILICMLLGIIFSRLLCNSRKLVSALCCLCLVMPLYSVEKNAIKVYYEDVTAQKLTDQNFLVESLSRTDEWSDKNMYFELYEDDNFLCRYQQELYLISELYGDMKCHDGGVQAFMEDDLSDYLMVDKEVYDHYEEQLVNTEIYVSNGEYYILRKKE